LKLEYGINKALDSWSRPTRACGLKCKYAIANKQGKVSRPTRACGLKSASYLDTLEEMKVTPHAGVWIEITNGTGG